MRAAIPPIWYLSKRAAAKMSSSSSPASSAPSLPLIVVIGSTGTGKSDLAVDLASRFDGEVINADAMQMYSGLPVLTNKLSPPLRRGVPHHLLDHVPLGAPPWVVGDFCRAAGRVAGEIRARGRVPVMAGGSTYYVLGFLAEGAATLAADEEEEGKGEPPPLPELEAPTEDLLARLRDLDPVMADRWHPRDRRKIRRSLEIYLRTGRAASSIYAAQQQRAPPRQSVVGTPLVFWVYSDRAALTERLDRRVDSMLEGGLLDEVRSMHALKRRQEAAGGGEKVDTTTGIWQSIGIRQLAPYVAALDDPDADPGALERLKQQSLASMRAATRQYASYQSRYIRKKFMPHFLPPAVAAAPAHVLDHDDEACPLPPPPPHHPRIFVLDSTDPRQWDSQVAGPAAAIAAAFLRGDLLPSPLDVSEAARSVLADCAAAVAECAAEVPCRRECRICAVTCTTESAWSRHVGGRSHQAAVRRAGRRALVVVPQGQDPETRICKKQEEKGEEGGSKNGARSGDDESRQGLVGPASPETGWESVRFLMEGETCA